MAISIKTPQGDFPLDLDAGQTAVLIGANGTGKTRLGAEIEQQVQDSKEVHRIGAQRSLQMRTKLDRYDFERAENILRVGTEGGGVSQRRGHRWQGRPATAQLDDFDALIRALYADESKLSVDHRKKHQADPKARPPTTKLDTVKKLWERVLPHRELIIGDGEIKVRPVGGNEDKTYDPAELSDGERQIFYLIGLCMMARSKCLLIIDEPELHVNKAIQQTLWDTIEGERDDCSFLYLTHDLEFAASRRGATKLVLRDYDAVAGTWKVDAVPEDVDLPEDVIAKILGSRLPIMFVEGTVGSLDIAVYRRVYDDWTVVPVGACEHVIHAVKTFTVHGNLHRLGCAGLIDLDGRTPDAIARLRGSNIYSLAVAGVENLFLLPTVFAELGKLLHFEATQITVKLEALKTATFQAATRDIESIAVSTAKRRIDAALKRVGLEARTESELSTEFASALSSIVPTAICSTVKAEINAAVAARDLEKVLALYGNKGLLAEVAQALNLRDRSALEELIGRALRSKQGKDLRGALAASLPMIVPTAAAPVTPAVPGAVGVAVAAE